MVQKTIPDSTIWKVSWNEVGYNYLSKFQLSYSYSILQRMQQKIKISMLLSTVCITVLLETRDELIKIACTNLKLLNFLN